MNAIYSFLSHAWSGPVVALLVGLVGLILTRVRRAAVVRWIGYLAIGLAALLMVGAAVGLVKTYRIRSQHPPMGKLVDVGGYRMHVLAEGEAGGRPTVVWMTGSHDGGLDLYPLHKRIRGEARSILFDRPGTGWSDVGPYPRSTPREVEEVRTLLEKAGEAGPFVLAGHSYGGLLAANFARRYRDRTAAVILLDPTPPDVFMYLPGGSGPGIPAGIVRGSERSGWAALFGLSSDPNRELVQRDTALASLLTTIANELKEVQGAIDAGRARPAYYWTTASMFREWRDPKQVADLTVYDGELGALPVYLVVPPGQDPSAPLQLGLSGPDGERAMSFLQYARMRYLGVSTRSELIHTAPGLTHNYPYQAPEFVIDVVRRVLHRGDSAAAERPAPDR